MHWNIIVECVGEDGKQSTITLGTIERPAESTTAENLGDFAPPPLTPPEVITAGQLVRFLKQVGTFDPNVFNEFRAQAGTQVLDLPANGALGFNIPSLLSVFAGTPYLHSGAAPTLEEVLKNVTHRSAGTGGVDTLTDPAARENLVTFLKSIDSNTKIFPSASR